MGRSYPNTAEKAYRLSRHVQLVREEWVVCKIVPHSQYSANKSVGEVVEAERDRPALSSRVRMLT